MTEIGHALEEFQPDIINVVSNRLGLAGLFYDQSTKIPVLASYPSGISSIGLGMLEGLLMRLLRLVKSAGSIMYIDSDDPGYPALSGMELWQRGVDRNCFI